MIKVDCYGYSVTSRASDFRLEYEMGSILDPTCVIPKDVKRCTCCCFYVRCTTLIERIVQVHFMRSLNFQETLHTIKLLVNLWILSFRGQISISWCKFIIKLLVCTHSCKNHINIAKIFALYSHNPLLYRFFPVCLVLVGKLCPYGVLTLWELL